MHRVPLHCLYTRDSGHIERVIRGNHLVTAVDVALQLGVSHCAADRIMHDVQGGSNMTGTDFCVNKPHMSRSYLNHLVLQYHKVCARWVPRQLTSELKEQHMNACEEHLGHCQTEGYVFL